MQAHRIISYQDRLTEGWHKYISIIDTDDELWLLIREQHKHNFSIWHYEDLVRNDIDVILNKHNIDYENQERNNAIERIDEFLIEQWPWAVKGAGCPANTETIASVIDRLSIASLRIYHIKEELACSTEDILHNEKWRHNLDCFLLQRKDLCKALDELILDVAQGKKRILVYHQFKMYNDPDVRHRQRQCSSDGRAADL